MINFIYYGTDQDTVAVLPVDFEEASSLKMGFKVVTTIYATEGTAFVYNANDFKNAWAIKWKEISDPEMDKQ